MVTTVFEKDGIKYRRSHRKLFVNVDQLKVSNSITRIEAGMQKTIHILGTGKPEGGSIRGWKNEQVSRTFQVSLHPWPMEISDIYPESACPTEWRTYIGYIDETWFLEAYVPVDTLKEMAEAIQSGVLTTYQISCDSGLYREEMADSFEEPSSPLTQWFLSPYENESSAGMVEWLNWKAGTTVA